MKLILATNIKDKRSSEPVKQPVGASMQKWCNCKWVPKAISESVPVTKQEAPKNPLKEVA